jgi:peptidoglycan/LPS O-acetylase OafA/YrhL
MSGPSEPRVFGLDFLRFLAITSVVLAHGGLAFVLVTVGTALFPALAPYASWSGLLWHGGFVGVELFFVLSGFLIGRILLRGAEDFGQPRNLLHFYLRRWFRTLPLFWLFIVFNILLERFLRDRGIGVTEALGHAFFTRNFHRISLSFFPESWSLAVEEWFYLLFPAVLWLGVRLTKIRFERIFVASAAVFFLLATGLRWWGALQPGAVWDGNQRCVVIFRFDALMAGVIAAWISLRYSAAWKRWAVPSAIAGVAVFSIAYASLWIFTRAGLGIAEPTFYAKTFRFSVFSLAFALLLPLASQWKPRRETFAHTGVRKIALWSYALYLVHWPLFQIAASPRFKPWENQWAPAALLFAGKVALAVALSYLLYRFYEAPLTRMREKFSANLGGNPRTDPPPNSLNRHPAAQSPAAATDL